MRRSLWAITLVSLSSCMGPCYDPQYVSIPVTWRLETDEGSTLCNLDWWKQFEDPVLNELIIIALQNNYDLKVAISRVYEYYARYRIVSSALFPTLNGDANFFRTENSLVAPGVVPLSLQRIFNDFQGFFGLSWELDFWGRVRSASEASYADFLSQIEARRAVVMTVVSAVATAYITLRQLDAQLEVSRNTLDTRIEFLKLARSRFNLGETSELEVAQAEAELEIAAIRVLEFERQIPIQENLVSVLLGENPYSIERGIAIDNFQYPITIPAGLPSDLLIRRPDIVEAEDVLIASNARVFEARALFFPQITLTGFYGSESTQLHNFLTAPAEMWQYGFNAVQSIFDAGKIVYQVKEAKAIRDEALFEYRQTILNAFREVDDALISCKKYRELVVEHERQVAILEEYLHLARLRYQEGEVDYLNVLDAERQLFDAQLNLATSQGNNFNAVVQLYNALGGGWVYEVDAIALSAQCCED